ncbi:MAG TPA: LytTR family DNA-binding domain-containing protein [Candidatus Limnocylindria bacterium]|nr:LytTR family DNA-binding domain-containing protein [Candidatus Limnocylindria bacterium]
MAVIRTLVVDDEKLARDRLAGFLRGLPDVTLVGEASDGVQALELISEHRPDLVFLDVQMPGMNGFDVLEALRPDVPHVVFATAYDEYAIRAFDVAAVDYLLKPFARARVAEAVARVRSRLATPPAPAELDALLARLNDRPREHLTRVPAHAGRRILLLKPEEILWFGVEHRLVYAHTAQRGFMTNFTLRELEERLDRDTFFRAHKATLVNLAQVQEIVPWFGGRFKLVMRGRDDAEVIVSRAQARELRQRLRW